MKVGGSGCGSVGRVVASNTRDPWFESSHRQKFILNVNFRKDKNQQKRGRNGPFLKKNLIKYFVQFVGSLKAVFRKKYKTDEAENVSLIKMSTR